MRRQKNVKGKCTLTGEERSLAINYREYISSDLWQRR